MKFLKTENGYVELSTIERFSIEPETKIIRDGDKAKIKETGKWHVKVSGSGYSEIRKTCDTREEAEKNLDDLVSKLTW